MNLVNPFQLREEAGFFWLKGNPHCHTTRSDGRASPQERVDGFARQGYGFLCLSDHHKITPVHSVECPEAMTLVQSAELHPENPYGGNRYHILALNLKEDVPTEGRHPQEVIDSVNAQGGQAWLAHPYWSSIKIQRDVLPLENWAGVEVFNTTCRNAGRGESSVHWDDWMDLTGGLIPAIASDDCHGKEEENWDTCQGWTMVRVRDRSPKAILDAMLSGACYSSNGPEIHDVALRLLERNGDGKTLFEASVQCSPARRIVAIHNERGTEYHRGGQLFENASFPLRVGAKYVRFEIIGPDGSKAWSNPIDLEALAGDDSAAGDG